MLFYYVCVRRVFRSNFIPDCPTPDTKNDSPLMIHIYCRCFGYQGGQQHGRFFTNALSKRHDVVLHPWDEVSDNKLIAKHIRLMLQSESRRDPIDIALGIGPMNRMNEVKGRRKIAFTVWETSNIPVEKLSFLDNMDEIWTPSTWGKSLFVNQGLSESLVKVVPEGVDTELFKPTDEAEAQRAEKPFRFLSVGKWEARKGLDKLIVAWSKAFKADADVELVLHCHNPFIPDFDILKILNQSRLKSAPVLISHPTDNSDNMVDLYNSCDVFVLPTRAEAWGLPIIEAMACAKPVIVTNYGGHLEYANQDNAYLIETKGMIDVDDPFFFEENLDFGQWSDPDIDHLIHLFHHVYDNRKEARQKGSKARKDIVSNWSWDHAVRKAEQFL